MDKPSGRSFKICTKTKPKFDNYIANMHIFHMSEKVGQIIYYKNMKNILTHSFNVLYNADTLGGSKINNKGHKRQI